MFTLASEPQGIGRTLDNGFKLFASGLKGVLGLMALLIVAMVGLVLAMTFGPMMLFDPMTTSINTILTFVGVVYFIMLVIMLTIQNGIVAKYGTVSHGNRIGMGTALKIGLRKVVPVIIWYILYLILVAVASLPAIAVGYFLPPNEGVLNLVLVVLAAIPTIILSMSLIFGVYLIVLENIGPIAAIKMSHRLVWGRWWRTLLFFVIVSIIMIVIMLAITVPLGVVVGMVAGNNPILVAILEMVVNILSLVLMPLSIALMITYIHDLKLRVEGSDLAGRIGATA